jgi:hypothetical protein
MKFKDDDWKTIQPQAITVRIPDDTCRGLFCQVTPKGIASWVLRYSKDGKQKIVTLGRCKSTALSISGITPSQARDMADEIRVKGTPLSKPLSREKEPPGSKVMLLKAAAEDFLRKYPHQSKAEARNKGVNLKRIVKALGSLPLDQITRKVVKGFLDDIVDEGHSATRNSCQRTLSRLFEYGQDRYEGCPEINPCHGIEYVPLKPRQVRLYAEELKALGDAVKRSKHLYRWGVIVPLLCGGRIGALEQISMGHFDKKKRLVEFNGVEGVKNLKTLHLSPEALWCWEQLPRVSASLIREAWEEIRVAAGFGNDFRRHDFRRTFKSVGADIKVNHLHVELLIGHSLGRIVETYLVADWQPLQETNDKVSKHLWRLMKLPALTQKKGK